MANRKRKKKRKVQRRLFLIATLLGVIGVFVVVLLYNLTFQSNIHKDAEGLYLYVERDDSYEDVLAKLEDIRAIKNYNALVWVLEQKNYRSHVIPGKYRLEPGMNNNQIANRLRSGDQEPVWVVINRIRTLPELAGVLGEALEPDSSEFLMYLRSPDVPHQYGFDRDNFLCMFVPDSYRFNWSTSVQESLDRFKQEYRKFWNENRRTKAERLGLNPYEVCILASIVYKETSRTDEYPKVAGVYLNRLKRGMKLQADPTLIYALGDFTIKRVLNEHKKVDSPYNTYRYKGLPPGPIDLPSVDCVDGVLNAEDHDYLYFCARSDFSGYHAFARNYAGHLLNARKYQAALNRRRIYR